MQIITLQEAKDQLGITFSSRDSYVTLLVNGVEARIFDYLKAATTEEAIAQAVSSGIAEGIAEATLKQAVLGCLGPVQKDSSFDIWKGGTLARMLFNFRRPALGIGSTS